MPRKFQFRYNAGIPGLIQTPRVQAVARERAFLRRHRNVPYLFGHTDDVAVSLRKRARDRMHATYDAQMYMRRTPPKRYKRPFLRIKAKPLITKRQLYNIHRRRF